MAESYCGKTCAECEHKEALNCPGCQAGPGRRHSGDCRLAECCTDKGHQSCSTCAFHQNCGTLRRRERMPLDRLKSIEQMERQAALVARRAPVLGRWLWILFWLVIPSTIASILTNEQIAEVIPGAFLPGQIISAVCALAYGAILLRLAAEEERYRTAGICALIAGAVSVLIACISGGGETPGWTMLLSVPAAVFSLVGDYNEFTAHAIVLDGVDYELSGKWEKLWKWHIGLYVAMVGSPLLVVLGPVLCLLVLLAAAIGVTVVSIVRLVYLYRTARLFRDYPLN